MMAPLLRDFHVRLEISPRADAMAQLLRNGPLQLPGLPPNMDGNIAEPIQIELDAQAILVPPVLGGHLDNFEKIPMDLDASVAQAQPCDINGVANDGLLNSVSSVSVFRPQAIDGRNNGATAFDNYERQLLNVLPFQAAQRPASTRPRRMSTAGGNHFIVDGSILEVGADYLRRVMLQTMVLNRFDHFQRLSNGFPTGRFGLVPVR